MKSGILRVLGVLLFVIGLLLVTAIVAIATWGDLEAMMFDPAIATQEQWSGLHCPVLMGATGAATVTAIVENPTARPLTLMLRMRTSHGFVTLMNQADTQVLLAAGEKRQVSWPVQPADAAFHLFVLVRVHVFPGGPFPYRSAACGIMVLNTPLLSGPPLLITMLVAGLLCLGAGLALWIKQHPEMIGRERTISYCMEAQAVALFPALIASLAGMWVIGLLLTVVVVLLGVGIVGQALAPTGL